MELRHSINSIMVAMETSLDVLQPPSIHFVLLFSSKYYLGVKMYGLRSADNNRFRISANSVCLEESINWTKRLVWGAFLLITVEWYFLIWLTFCTSFTPNGQFLRSDLRRSGHFCAAFILVVRALSVYFKNRKWSNLKVLDWSSRVVNWTSMGCQISRMTYGYLFDVQFVLLSEPAQPNMRLS